MINSKLHFKAEPNLVHLLMMFAIVGGCVLVKIGAFPTRNIEVSPDLEQSFKDYVKSVPDSTVVGHVRPNASELELILLRKKIADTILAMQELEREKARQKEDKNRQPITDAECFIEVTKVDRVPGRCHKIPGGSPICHADPYVSMSNDCGSS